MTDNTSDGLPEPEDTTAAASPPWVAGSQAPYQHGGPSTPQTEPITTQQPGAPRSLGDAYQASAASYGSTPYQPPEPAPGQAHHPGNAPQTAGAGQGYGDGPWSVGKSTAAGPGGTDMTSDAAGFFSALFDFSFTHFITPKVVKGVYTLAAGGLIFVWLILLLLSLAGGALVFFVVLVIGPVFVLSTMIFVRLTLEFYLATVRMSEDIHQRLR